MRISIILLTCNRIALLKQVIAAFEEKLTTPYELIVINNNSEDGTTEYLNELKNKVDYPIKLIFNKKGDELTSTYAFTEGMKYVKSEYFITTQDDLVIPHLELDVLQQMILLMEKYPECGALSLRDQNMKRHPIGDEEIMYNIGACPAWFRMQKKSDMESVDGFGKTNRWEAGLMMRLCLRMNKKAGFASNLWCKNIGLGPTRGYPDWHIENMKGNKNFEWVENRKHQRPKKEVDIKTNKPI